MRFYATIATVFSLSFAVAIAQPDAGFSGTWKLNQARSDIHNLPAPPDPYLTVVQSATTLTWSGSLEQGGGVTATWSYSLDGKPQKRQVGESTANTVTKWEGSALLVNSLVSGPENYTVMERWQRARDGSSLTVKQTIVRLSGESESVLVYDNVAAGAGLQSRLAEHAPAVQPAAAPVQTANAAPTTKTAPEPISQAPAEYVVEPGTRMLLRLTNSVNTKHTAAGDHVYLETAVPIYVNERLVIPRGSYVVGTVTEAHQAGRVKGRSGLSLRFESVTLPNGVTRTVRSLPGSVDGRGDLNRKEGKIEGEGNKGGDARTVGETTAAGTGIGTLAGAASGHLGMGAGIGAAAGAAAGLAKVLGSRGPDVVLPQGTTMELVLDRELRFTEAELRGRVQ